jgi:hypothetical protein
VPLIKEVIKEVEVVKEVPVEVAKWHAHRVPVVKIVEVSRHGVPRPIVALSQRLTPAGPHP